VDHEGSIAGVVQLRPDVPGILGRPSPIRVVLGVFGMQITRATVKCPTSPARRSSCTSSCRATSFSGIDKAKLYVDPGVSDAQRTQLDSIFHGEQGGLWAACAKRSSNGCHQRWRRSTSAATTPRRDRRRNRTGHPPADQGRGRLADHDRRRTGDPRLRYESGNLAYAARTSFADPELRSWESLGAAALFLTSSSGQLSTNAPSVPPAVARQRNAILIVLLVLAAVGWVVFLRQATEPATTEMGGHGNDGGR